MVMKKVAVSIALLILVFIILCSYTALPVQALMLEMSLEELTTGSDAIVTGTVESVNSNWIDDYSAIVTTVVFRVADYYKGGNRESLVVVEVPGGTVGGITQMISDIPHFSPGEEALLFLSKTQREQAWAKYPEPVPFELHGLFQGKINIDHSAAGEPILEELEVLISNLEELEDGELIETELKEAGDEPELVGYHDFVYNGMYWHGTSPVVDYRVNASNARTTHINAAAETWNNAGANFRFQYIGQHSRNGVESRNFINEIMFYNIGSTHVLAYAVVWYSGNRILETDMVFNTNFHWSTSLPTPWGYHDVQTVALHELGHWLSLGHSHNTGSVMYERILGTRRTLHADDIAGIRYIYGTSVSAPVNDDFADRITISGPTGRTTGSNVEATLEPNEPVHHHFSAGRSVWWQWQAPADGTAVIDTFGSNFDTILAVYTGSSLQSLQLVASNDDAPHTLQSRVEFAATGGTVYQVAVAGYSGASGNINLNWNLTLPSCNINTPLRPEGPDQGFTGNAYTFSVDSVQCSNGHAVEYRFSFGDGSYSNWSGSASASKSWPEAGTFEVSAQARCAVHNDFVSGWSPVKAIAITEEIKFYTLTLSIEGEGSINPAAGSYQHAEGTAVELTAVPANDWEFSHWEGADADSTEPDISIVIDGDLDFRAVFTYIEPEQGNGSDSSDDGTGNDGNGTGENPDPGENEDSGAGENDEDPDGSGDDQENSEDHGDQNNSEDSGGDSGSESGSSSGGGAAPPAPQPVPGEPATVSETIFNLTMSYKGEGNISPSAGVHNHAKGSTVGISAKPAPGWLFDRWVINGAAYRQPDGEIEIEVHTSAQAYFIRAAKGDITGDGNVTVNDVTLLMRHCLGLASLDEDRKALADINGDGEINVLDITMLMRFALGLISELP